MPNHMIQSLGSRKNIKCLYKLWQLGKTKPWRRDKRHDLSVFLSYFRQL